MTMTLESEREAFERWMRDVMMYPADDLIFQPTRNCYADYSTHLAFSAWLTRAHITQPAQAHHCNLCGGAVDLSGATAPTVRLDTAGRGKPSRPAQAVDVGRLFDLIGKYWDLAYAEGKEGRDTDTQSGDAQRVWNEIERTARALSAEKAGCQHDADAQWALRFKAAVNAIESEQDQPMTAACGLLMIDACVDRKAKKVTLNFDGVEHKDGRDLGDWIVTVQCRRKGALPASPTPDKEGRA